jgi:hypothetical protein
MFGRRFAHTILAASTERPAMPAFTPLLDALKAEKSAQRAKEALQRNTLATRTLLSTQEGQIQKEGHHRL